MYFIELFEEPFLLFNWLLEVKHLEAIYVQTHQKELSKYLFIFLKDFQQTFILFVFKYKTLVASSSSCSE